MDKVRKLTPKQEDRRQRILAAAREMVADNGYDGMVMSQVAERANVSPTTLYNLYNTKDELVLASLQELLVENAKEVASQHDGPGWRYLLASVKNGSQMANSEPAYAEAITHALQRANAGDALVKVLMLNGRQDMVNSLDTMAVNGELREGVDTFELGTALMGVYWSTFILWNKGLIKLQEMEHALQMNFLSLMIPATQGDTRTELENLLVKLG